MAGTVTIGCKLPAGLHLNIFAMEAYSEVVMGGGSRDTMRARPIGRVTINGTGRREDDPRIVGGYALTHNVDADVWAEWLKANADSDLVRKNLIFAQVKPTEAQAEGRAGETLRNGLEPIDIHDVPREFKGKVKHEPYPKSAF